ncbi:MAG: amidohydrolase family protein [Desulfobacterales bacterium]|nr:amidohydrolase family protein [Desulfobacterales bacterium]
MIIDFHTHIFPKDVRNNREYFFFNEPEFRLLYESKNSKMIGMQDLILEMDLSGVDKSVIFGFPWNNLETAKKNNDYIIEAVNKYPKQLIGLCCLNPLSKNSSNEVERCINAGLKGIGEVALYNSGITEEILFIFEPLMEILQKHNMPLLLHTNEPVGHKYPGKSPIRLSEIYNFVKKFSKNIIVLAHWGGGLFFFNLLKKEVKDILKNVYVDTAASPFLYHPDIYKFASQIFGADKILFGSDFPLIQPSRYFSEIKQLNISTEDINKILGDNASIIFEQYRYI